ncbi:hypothetical protein [Edaphobacter modestus]|uniref:Outer membrane lipoprotein-sorting protein n=1 Tax=Edaphobacter modestus TaxID=388466 RepID=A0A4Q7YTZ5_9BACT|nr:hypothetical protein [Edaphobacter modestus]RZU41237.1 hypothetical protein BDD14_2742 [Edaphobacter modestus]
MKSCSLGFTFAVSVLSAGLLASNSSAQAHLAPNAQQLVKVAVDTELAADRADQSRWRYRSTVRRADGEFVYEVVETTHGSVKKLIQKNGQFLNPAELEKENQRIDSFVHDPSQQAKKQKDSQQDDKRAEDMLRLLPDAFLWTLRSDAPEGTTFSFVPAPGFNPSSMEARVFAAMAGEILVSKPEHRIQRISGKLIRDVTFGFGLFGRMQQGGTFHVERRALAPKVWQITESHVHIQGHILLFKTINEQEDEVKTDFRPSPPAITLEQAASLLHSEPASLSARR